MIISKKSLSDECDGHYSSSAGLSGKVGRVYNRLPNDAYGYSRMAILGGLFSAGVYSRDGTRQHGLGLGGALQSTYRLRRRLLTPARIRSLGGGHSLAILAIKGSFCAE